MAVQGRGSSRARPRCRREGAGGARGCGTHGRPRRDRAGSERSAGPRWGRSAPGPRAANPLRAGPRPRQRHPPSRRHRGPGGTRGEADAGAGGRTVIPVSSLPCWRRGSRGKASLWCGAARDAAVSGQTDGVTLSCCRPGPIPIPPPAPWLSPLAPANASRWRLHARSLPWHPECETGLWAPLIPAGRWPWRLLSPPERSWQFLLTVSLHCSSSSSSSSSAKPAGPPHVPRRPQLLMWMSQGMKRSTCYSPDLPGDWGIRLCRRSCARLDAYAATRVLDQAR